MVFPDEQSNAQPSIGKPGVTGSAAKDGLFSEQSRHSKIGLAALSSFLGHVDFGNGNTRQFGICRFFHIQYLA